MKKNWIIFTAIISIIAFSCKKDDETTVTPKADYYQLKAGNYWVYQEYDIDTNGVVTTKDNWDSVYIEKDTIIGLYKYYKIWEKQFIFMPSQGSSFIRDSSGYLVGTSGIILCSDDNFTDILFADTLDVVLAKRIGKMTGRDSIISVPADSFQSITNRMAVIPVQPTDPNPTRYVYNSYGKGVGKIKTHSFFYGAGNAFEARLVRYKVN
jgi:hypothetical protein